MGGRKGETHRGRENEGEKSPHPKSHKSVYLAEAVQINLTWKGVIAIRERKVTWVYFPEELTI